MKYLNRWTVFEDKNEEKKEGKSDEPRQRSERLLSQAQVEYKEKEDVQNQVGDELPTMVFTDVVGSSKMWSDDAVSMMAQLQDHHNLVDKTATKYNGWIVKTIGDAFMVYFEPSKDSLLNALKFSKDLILNEGKYNLRIGVCQGPMESKTYRIQKVDLKDFFGNPVNVASRMESKVAENGGTVAFSSVKTIGANQVSQIKKEIGVVYNVDLKKYNLRGASIDKAFRIKIK